MTDEDLRLPDFPEVFDSTMRSAFIACPRQFFWSYLEHLRKPGLSVHLHFGGCFARGLEVTRKTYYRDAESIKYALCAGHNAIIETWGDVEFGDLPRPSAYKTLPACHDALASYFEQWPLDTDDLQPHRPTVGEPCIEMSFAVPIDGTAHPTTGKPIVYAGRFDMLADWQEANTVFVCDEKTSSSLGVSWRNNWKLRGQLTGYCYGARSYGINVAGAIVRGVGILAGDITFEQVIETRPAWMIEVWLRQLRYDINRAADMWQQMRTWGVSDEVRQTVSYDIPLPREAWPQALDSACSSYGGCQFLDLCDSEHPERWIDNYDRHEWNPLKRMVE